MTSRWNYNQLKPSLHRMQACSAGKWRTILVFKNSFFVFSACQLYVLVCGIRLNGMKTTCWSSDLMQHDWLMSYKSAYNTSPSAAENSTAWNKRDLALIFFLQCVCMYIPSLYLEAQEGEWFHHFLWCAEVIHLCSTLVYWCLLFGDNDIFFLLIYSCSLVILRT